MVVINVSCCIMLDIATDRKDKAMTNATHTAAIDAIVSVYIENDSLEKNYDWFMSHCDKTRAEIVEREICKNSSKIIGMTEMLSMLSGKEYDEIIGDVMTKVFEYRKNNQ